MDTVAPDDDRAVASLLAARARSLLWLPVEGSSMGEAIVTGSSVRVVSGSEHPRVGEVWAFVDGGEVIVHRCLGSRGSSWRFCGDRSAREDRPAPSAHLIGRAEEARGPDGSLRPISRRRRSARVKRLELLGRRLAARVTLDNQQRRQ